MESTQADSGGDHARPGLAAGQKICTSAGLVAAADLARSGVFTALCCDPASHEIVLRPAKIAAAGRGRVLELHTDKGAFTVCATQPVKLADGAYVSARDLEPGVQLWAYALGDRPDDLIDSHQPQSESVVSVRLVPAVCAIVNWHPRPSVKDLGPGDLFEVNFEGAGWDKAAPGSGYNLALWAPGAGGGVGIVVASAGLARG